MQTELLDMVHPPPTTLELAIIPMLESDVVLDRRVGVGGGIAVRRLIDFDVRIDIAICIVRSIY